MSLAATLISPMAATAATVARIGVYFDAAGTQCSGTIRPGTPGTIYILAKMDLAERVSGAEFRFIGLPASWAVFPVPNPETFSFGNPFTTGVNIVGVGGAVCDPAGSPLFLLYTVLVLATNEIDNVRFELAKRDPPANPWFSCPLVTGCDGPAFTKHCVETDPCFVNSVTPVPCATTGVEATSWTAVRSFYR